MGCQCIIDRKPSEEGWSGSRRAMLEQTLAFYVCSLQDHTPQTWVAGLIGKKKKMQVDGKEGEDERDAIDGEIMVGDGWHNSLNLKSIKISIKNDKIKLKGKNSLFKFSRTKTMRFS